MRIYKNLASANASTRKCREAQNDWAAKFALQFQVAANSNQARTAIVLVQNLYEASVSKLKVVVPLLVDEDLLA